MITNSKLNKRSGNKLLKERKHAPRDNFSLERGGKRKKFPTMALLPILMIVVAGVTFSIIMLVYPKNNPDETAENTEVVENTEEIIVESEEETIKEGDAVDEGTASIQPITNAVSNNPTIPYGRLMLINPNFTVETEFIQARRGELISLHTTYGIIEMNAGNGDNLLDPEAAEQLNKMLSDYTVANPGHTMQTVSCFRMVGTSCGRLCAATGASDHHTGLTCDLIDPIYGTSLDTDAYEQHYEWQWLKENSYKYGFIDRFPAAWAGGSMAEPLNVNAEGTTGLFETWHYRYVGVYAATEIATGIYNNGEYDSLEHYLLARNLVTNLLNN